MLGLGSAPTLCYPTKEVAQKAGEQAMCPVSMPRTTVALSAVANEVLPYVPDQCWENFHVEQSGACFRPVMEGQAYYSVTGLSVPGTQSYPSWIWIAGAAAILALLFLTGGRS